MSHFCSFMVDLGVEVLGFVFFNLMRFGASGAVFKGWGSLYKHQRTTPGKKLCHLRQCQHGQSKIKPIRDSFWLLTNKQSGLFSCHYHIAINIQSESHHNLEANVGLRSNKALVFQCWISVRYFRSMNCMNELCPMLY